MNWGWLRWVGVVVAGAVGACVAMMAARIVNDTSLLVNPNVVGAAIGASITITATLIISAQRRRQERRDQVEPLHTVLQALRIMLARAVVPPIAGASIPERAELLRVHFRGLAAQPQSIAFARQIADVKNMTLWVCLNKIEELLTSFDVDRADHVRLLSDPDVNEVVLRNALDRIELLRERLDGTLPKAIEIVASEM